MYLTIDKIFIVLRDHLQGSPLLLLPQSKSPSIFVWTIAVLLPSLLQLLPPTIQALYNSWRCLSPRSKPSGGKSDNSKFFIMAYETLYGLTPAYLSTLSQPSLSPACSASALMAFLLFYRNTKLFFPWKLSPALSSLWNTLPLDLHTADSFLSFRFQVRYHLFGDFCGHPIGCVSQSLYHIVLSYFNHMFLFIHIWSYLLYPYH